MASRLAVQLADRGDDLPSGERVVANRFLGSVMELLRGPGVPAERTKSEAFAYATNAVRVEA